MGWDQAFYASLTVSPNVRALIATIFVYSTFISTIFEDFCVGRSNQAF